MRRVVLSILILVVVLLGCGKQESAIGTQEKVQSGPGGESIRKEDSIYRDVQGEDFSSYSGVVLTGTDVSEVLRMYRNSNLALLVATQMVMDGTLDYNHLDGNVAESTPTVGVKGITGLYNTSGEPLDTILTLINYGALLKQDEQGTFITYKDGYFLTDQGLVGDKAVNLEVSKAFTAGYSENLADYLYLQSSLLKDTEGNTVGLVFYSVPK